MTIQQVLMAGSGGFTALEAVQSAGLTSNLVLCLDAGDGQSYASGTKWLDRSGNGYDFDITGATLTGAPGARSSYFALDGSSYFTYDTTNETWMQNIHKDNAIYTFIAFYYLASSTASQGFAGTSANDPNNIGFRYIVNDTPAGLIVIDDGSGVSALSQILPTATEGAWNMHGVSIDEAGGVVSFGYVNGVDGSAFDAAYTTPSASSATYTFQVGATGNNANLIESGGRFGIFMAWSGTALTAANMDSLWTNLRGRYGI